MYPYISSVIYLPLVQLSRSPFSSTFPAANCELAPDLVQPKCFPLAHNSYSPHDPTKASPRRPPTADPPPNAAIFDISVSSGDNLSARQTCRHGGIDVRGIKRISNYDLQSIDYGGIEEYTHRIGMFRCAAPLAQPFVL